MKKQYWKTCLAVLLLAAAGFIYSCSGDGISENIGEDQTESLGTSALTESEADTQAPVYQYIHICGEVMNPGVYQVEEGSRIFQAVELAGGFTEEAAAEVRHEINRARDNLIITLTHRKYETEIFHHGGSRIDAGRL